MRIRRLLTLAALLAAMLAPSGASAATWNVDPTHSSVIFRVRHLFTSVTGRFERFAGTIEFDPADPKTAKVSGSIEVESVNTDVEKRDKHLRGADFFEAGKHPEISFQSTRVVSVADDGKSGRLSGTLTIRGVTKSVVLEVRHLGEGKDPWGNLRAGFRATTTIDRKDFGLVWNQTLETGGFLVGDEVTIEIEVQALAAE